MQGENNYVKAEQLMTNQVMDNSDCVVLYLNNATKKLTKFNKFNMRVLHASLLRASKLVEQIQLPQKSIFTVPQREELKNDEFVKVIIFPELKEYNGVSYYK